MVSAEIAERVTGLLGDLLKHSAPFYEENAMDKDLCYAIESAFGMIALLASGFIVGWLVVEAVRALLRRIRERWVI
jgi:hypothetical protein